MHHWLKNHNHDHDLNHHHDNVNDNDDDVHHDWLEDCEAFSAKHSSNVSNNTTRS